VVSFDPRAVARALRPRLGLEPQALLVLGSGLSGVADAVEDAVSVPFEALPGFPTTGVVGHAGRFVAGRLAGRPVLVQAGRFHLYEGHPPGVVCGTVRVAHDLGIGSVLLTNAAGGVNPLLAPGTLMVLDDHVRWGGTGGVAGWQEEREAPPPGIAAPYDPELNELAIAAAAELGIPLARGVYAQVLGPSFETPAEIRALARSGADAVGMSTVPEALAAHALGISCLAISLITNAAAGTTSEPLSHDEVISVARDAGPSFARLIRRIVRDLPVVGRAA
jgi:purine-nucleoside phosphorylase